MLAITSTFWVPKRGSSPQEYEDAVWVGPDGDGSGELQASSLTMAIADGASESLLAGRWARRLVEVFGTNKATRTRPAFVAAYRMAVGGWDEEVAEYTKEREERGSPIQWYEEPGFAKGAHATILAAEFRDGRSGRAPAWSASALGDSCLFQVRDELLYASFPMSDATSFTYQPSLLGSRGADEAALRRHVKVTSSRLGTRRQLLPYDGCAGSLVLATQRVWRSAVGAIARHGHTRRRTGFRGLG